MHIMGGFGVASLTAAILSYKGIKVSYTKLFIAYIVVAIAWEIYEYIHDLIIARDWNGWFDTTKDLVDGFLGMSFAYLFVRK